MLIFVFQMKLCRERVSLFTRAFKLRFILQLQHEADLPKSSEVLTAYLRHRQCPSWTAFYLPLCQVKNDLFGCSHFNHRLDDDHNYHVLRTGAFPFVKFHCTLRPEQDLTLENTFYNVLKVANLGFPCFLYGCAGLLWTKYEERFQFDDTNAVTLFFWYKETW